MDYALLCSHTLTHPSSQCCLQTQTFGSFDNIAREHLPVWKVCPQSYSFSFSLSSLQAQRSILMAHQPQALAPRVALPCQVGKCRCFIILVDHRQQKGPVSQELSLAVDKWGIWPLVYPVDPVLSEGFVSVIHICKVLPKNGHNIFIVGSQSLLLTDGKSRILIFLKVHRDMLCKYFFERQVAQGEEWIFGERERLGFKSQLCHVHTVQAHYTYSASWSFSFLICLHDNKN